MTSRSVLASLPSHPENSAKASPTNSRSEGRGGSTRCPHAEQKAPWSGSPQLRQRCSSSAVTRSESVVHWRSSVGIFGWTGGQVDRYCGYSHSIVAGGFELTS